MSTQPLRIVIIGGVAGGASAATRARRCNEHAEIVLLEKDAHVSFANCGLPYYLGGEIVDRNKLLVAKPELFRDRFRIDVRTHSEAIAIDRTQSSVRVRHTQTGDTYDLPYDRLILAPGAAPIVPPIAGTDAENVFTLRNLEDTDRLHDCLTQESIRRIAVVGAGFIGLEMVEQLHRRGKSPVLVELAPQVLAPLDPEMAAPVESELRQHGIELHLGAGLKSIESNGNRATAVILDNGTKVAADAFLLGMGVRPNVALARDAGLVLGPGGGIAVNEYLQTSDPRIYAAGDAVEYPRTYAGQPMRIPLAGPANRAGRIAGEHAATGHAEPMGAVQATAILRIFGKAAASTGLSEKMATRLGIPVKTAYVNANHHAGYYPGAQPMLLKLIYAPDNGKVLGAQAVGGDGVDKRMDVIATVLHFGGTVKDLAALDLSYAPPFGSAKDPLHQVAFVATNDLAGRGPLLPPASDLNGLQVLDVRNPEELQCMRMADVVAIPVDRLRDHLDRLDPNKPTAVLCHSGQRAYLAARILMQQGFRDVRVLTGGMLVRQYSRPETVIR
jgi:NADPH-dependent 2,4-dienoyl-CoA reductase/sulfur reductase-like enzyme/rhodanese-related sulfurtransferase